MSSIASNFYEKATNPLALIASKVSPCSICGCPQGLYVGVPKVSQGLQGLPPTEETSGGLLVANRTKNSKHFQLTFSIVSDEKSEGIE